MELKNRVLVRECAKIAVSVGMGAVCCWKIKVDVVYLDVDREGL